MMKSSFVDYLACILFKAGSFLARLIPLPALFFLARRAGDLMYFFDLKHRCRVYSNLKTAFGSRMLTGELKHNTRKFYQAFSQNLVEFLLIPSINHNYIQKYVSVEGVENVHNALAKGKGFIFLAMHEGSWEIANLVTANYGLTFWMFVREQKLPLFNQMLNSYRISRGARIIKREEQSKQLIKLLKNNECMAMTVDQGGKNGMIVDFFGKQASMATGAIRLALKYDCALLPIFTYRIKGPYLKLIVDKPVQIKRSSQENDADVRENLEGIMRRFENFISGHPQEYLWTYKVWKYSQEKNILILHDGKTGHLRQSEALAKITSSYLAKKNVKANVSAVEVQYKSKFAQNISVISNVLSGKYICQGCQKCLKWFLKKDCHDSLSKLKPDIIISCGSKAAAVNYLLSRENQAKSFVIMKPPFMALNRFDLVVIPEHDKPLHRKNVVVTKGALNLIDKDYLLSCESQMAKFVPPDLKDKPVVGVLLGGDSKKFSLDTQTVKQVIEGIKHSVQSIDANLLLTTSRRSSRQVEDLAKHELKNFAPCRFLVIANEKNYPFAVGGILAYSDIIIISPESISMVSEAINSGKFVVVFNSSGLRAKHESFLKNLAKGKIIYLCKPQDLAKTIENLAEKKPEVNILNDNYAVEQALEKIL